MRKTQHVFPRTWSSAFSTFFIFIFTNLKYTLIDWNRKQYAFRQTPELNCWTVVWLEGLSKCILPEKPAYKSFVIYLFHVYFIYKLTKVQFIDCSPRNPGISVLLRTKPTI